MASVKHKNKHMTEGQKTKILYIEDDFASSQLVQRVLLSRGYDVLLSDNGLEGITIARKEQPHLILMDINLPDMDGREITTRLRGLPNFSHTPIVALTANNSPGSRELALAAGCTGFLTKPIDVATFPKDVEEFLEGRAEPLSADEYNKHLQLHAQNIVKRLEDKVRELENTNHRLRELDRLKSDFIVLVSHELRTPLTLLHGYTNLLKENIKQSEVSIPLSDLNQIVTGLSSGVNRMQVVIDEIISVSRISSGKLDISVGPVRLPHMMEALKIQFQETIMARRLTFNLSDLSHLPLVEGDGKQLKTAFAHIISNAIKYTPDKGRIYVAGRLLDNTVDIMVKDTGIGIPLEEQRQIFDQFYALGSMAHHSTSKSAFQGGGLGLGLAITKGIIEAHHGRIWVDSDRRDASKLPGSTFHILLPLKQPKK